MFVGDFFSRFSQTDKGALFEAAQCIYLWIGRRVFFDLEACQFFIYTFFFRFPGRLFAGSTGWP